MPVSRKALLLTLLALLAARPEAQAKGRSPAVPSAYAELLHEHMMKIQAPGGGFDTRFDYPRLAARKDGAELRRRIRRAFLAVEPESLDAATHTAWAVNAYNFLVIDLVTENYRSASGDTLRSIGDIGKGKFSIFDEPRFRIGTATYSLNRFERHFLFQDADRTAKKSSPGLDPRLHFAIVCGAVGCPPLLMEPYEPVGLDAQLDFAVRNALQSRRHLVFDPADTARVRVSKVFDWYRADFGTEAELRAFLVHHAPSLVGDRLRRSAVTIDPALDWDWSLNRP